MSTRLFWPLTGADFTRAIKRSRNGINAVADQIRGKLSSIAGQPARCRGTARGEEFTGCPAPSGTKIPNTLIHAKPAARSGALERNSADTPDRGRLGGNF